MTGVDEGLVACPTAAAATTVCVCAFMCVCVHVGSVPVCLCGIYIGSNRVSAGGSALGPQGHWKHVLNVWSLDLDHLTLALASLDQTFVLRLQQRSVFLIPLCFYISLSSLPVLLEQKSRLLY